MCDIKLRKYNQHDNVVLEMLSKDNFVISKYGRAA